MAYRVTLIPGDGIGPELAEATRRVLDASGVAFEWELQDAGEAVMAEYGTPLPEHVLESVRRNRIALKGPITTPVGSGFRSVNVTLRQTLGLYANLRPARSIQGLETRYADVDLVIVRENTEDLYAGIEHMVGPDAAESIKIITRAASERIARFAFDYAVANGRHKVTAVHKANIMKLSDGLFLESCRTVAADYDGRIEFEDRIVDNMCMQLVQKPDLYDVLVLPNLYGDIVSDLCAGLVGGLGVAPGANIGTEASVFEPVHGSAPKYAGQDKANPTAMILSGVLMLRHLGEQPAAERVEAAVRDVIAEGKHTTYDLGGDAGTRAYADAIIDRLGAPARRPPRRDDRDPGRASASRASCRARRRPGWGRRAAATAGGSRRSGRGRCSRSSPRTCSSRGIVWTPLFGTGVRGRRLPVAVLLAADRARLAARVLARPADPVDPARLPDHLLLLPQGLLPLVLRRPAGLRGGRAAAQGYCGETKFPFILQNLHRYFLYLAFVPLFFLWVDVVASLFPAERPAPRASAA